MALTQSGYRFGINELAESTHGWLANLNTAISRDATDLTTFLCRVLLQNDAAGAVNNVAPTWQYSLNGGAWTAITTGSSVVKAVTPSCWADAADCTARLGGTGTFDATNNGCTADGVAGGNAMDIVVSGNNESEIALQLVAGLSPGNTIDLRVLNGASTLTYTQTPRISITGPTAITLESAGATGAGGDASAALAPALDAGGATAAAPQNITASNSWIETLLSGAATGAGSDVLAPLAAPLDGPAAAAGAGFDLLAPETVTLAVTTAAGAGSDITPSEQPAGSTVVLEGATATSGGADLLESATVQLDLATASGAGQELTIALAPGFTLDSADVPVQGFELPAAVAVPVALVEASCAAAGADLDLIITPYVLLETAEVAVSGESVELGESRRIALDPGVALARGNLVSITPPDVTFQDFEVIFGGQSFGATFGETQILEAVA
jgi:hypothetical protein